MRDSSAYFEKTIILTSRIGTGTGSDGGPLAAGEAVPNGENIYALGPAIGSQRIYFDLRCSRPDFPPAQAAKAIAPEGNAELSGKRAK